MESIGYHDQQQQEHNKLQDEYAKKEKKKQEHYKKIQKINDNLDPNKKESLYKFPFSQLSFGSSRGGKSTAIKKLFMDPKFRIMERVDPEDIYIVSPTVKLDNTIRELIDFLAEKGFNEETQAFEDVLAGVQLIKERMKMQRAQKQDKKNLIPHILILFDDCINCFKWIEALVTELSTIGRHLNCSFILTSQSHKKINNVIRRNATHISVHGLNIQGELDSLADEYRSAMSKKQMIELINRVINSPGFNNILICQQKPVQERYIINTEDIVLLSLGNQYITIDTPVNDLQGADGSLDMNNNTIINLADPVYSQDAVTKAYVDSHQGIDQSFADGRYYLNTTPLNSITAPTGNLSLNGNRITSMANAQSDTDALNRQTADGRYYSNTTVLNSISAPTGNLSLNTKRITNLADAQSATDALNLQTADGKYYQNTTTLNSIVAPTGNLSLNTYKITNLQNGTLTQDAITKGQLDSDFKSKIQTTATTTSVQCVNDTITFNIGNTEKLKVYVPSGQATNPVGLITSDKMQLVSGLGSYSFNTTKAQVATPGFNTNGVSIQMANDMTKNQNCQLSLQCANSSGAQQSQCLTIDTGHVDVGAGQQNYSIIYNKAVEGVQQNLQLSGGTPQVDNTLNLYSTSFATAIGQNLTAQFIGKTGYSSAVACTESNQFTPKTYVDTNFFTKTYIQATYQTIASMSNYVTSSSLTTTLSDYALIVNYYTKTVTDSTFQTIANMSNYVTSVSLATTLQSYVLASTLSQYYPSTYINATFATIASLSGYYANTTPLNNITLAVGSVNLNSQKIIGLATPTLSTDAVNKAYADSLGTVSLPTGAIQMWPLVAPPTNYLVCDGSSFSQVTYPALYAVLGTTTLPDLRGVFVKGYDGTRTINTLQAQNVGSHTHTTASYTGATTNDTTSQHQHAIPIDRSETAGGNNAGAGSILHFGSGLVGGPDTTYNLNTIKSQTGGSLTASQTGQHIHNFTIPQSTSATNSATAENRPANVNLQYIIKAI